MRDEIAYFCPRCQSMDLKIQKSLLVSTGRDEAQCELCEWKGPVEDLVGALNPQNEQFWNAERIASALLMAVTKHAAGPLVQVLELIGLVPKIEGSAERQESARQVRESVMKAVLEGAVVGAFETAALLSPVHFRRFDAPMGQEADRIFNEDKKDPTHEPS